MQIWNKGEKNKINNMTQQKSPHLQITTSLILEMFFKLPYLKKKKQKKQILLTFNLFS